MSSKVLVPRLGSLTFGHQKTLLVPKITDLAGFQIGCFGWFSWAGKTQCLLCHLLSTRSFLP